MNPGSSVIDPRSYVTASAAGATRSIFDPRTVTTTFRCTARPSKTCAARIVTGAPACCAGRLVGPATKISNQVRRRLVIGFTWLRMIPEIVRHFAWHGRKDEINVWKLCPTNAGTNHKRHSAATPQPNADAVAVWTELECVIFPSSQRRGACAIKKMPRSHKTGADGLVSSAGLRRRAVLTTPSATNRNGSIVFDVADTPPLRGGERAAPKTLSKKLKVAALLHKKHKKSFVNFVPFVAIPLHRSP